MVNGHKAGSKLGWSVCYGAKRFLESSAAAVFAPKLKIEVHFLLLLWRRRRIDHHRTAVQQPVTDVLIRAAVVAPPVTAAAARNRARKMVAAVLKRKRADSASNQQFFISLQIWQAVQFQPAISSDRTRNSINLLHNAMLFSQTPKLKIMVY
jgi:hypothetical protein